jgi:hypothetical protein
MGFVKNGWDKLTHQSGLLGEPSISKLGHMTGVTGLYEDVLKGSKQMGNSIASPFTGGRNVFSGVNQDPNYVPPADPNAPGSIFNMNKPPGPVYNPAAMPAPGTPTNGLANGAQSGGINWAPIIAKALMGGQPRK